MEKIKWRLLELDVGSYADATILEKSPLTTYSK